MGFWTLWISCDNNVFSDLLFALPCIKLLWNRLHVADIMDNLYISFGPKYTISQSICCLSHLCRFRFSLCYLSVLMVYLALIRHFFLIYILELFSCVHLDCSSTCSCSNPWRTSSCCYNVSTQTFTIEQMTRSYCVTVCTSLSILWKGTLLED